MIDIQITNMHEVLSLMGDQLGILIDSDNMLRTVATGMLPELRYRIHTEGKAADGGLISNKGYSDGYLDIREKNNRGRDRKVIFSLTRTMENLFTVLPSDDGKGWGLGFRNSPTPNSQQTYADLAIHLEQLYGKKVYALSVDEEQKAEEIINGFVTEAFNALR